MNELLTKLKIPEKAITFLDDHLILTTLAVAALSILIAFFGYKFFKVLLVIGGAIGAGFAVSSYLIPAIIDKLPEIPLIKLSDIIIVVGAALGALLGFTARKVCVFLGSGAGGYFLAHGVLYQYIFLVVPENFKFMENPIIKIAISVLFAIIFACICERFFKLIFILATSMGGLAVAALFLANLVLIDMGLTAAYIALGAGAAIGIAAVVVQFKMNPQYKPIF